MGSSSREIVQPCSRSLPTTTQRYRHGFKRIGEDDCRTTLALSISAQEPGNSARCDQKNLAGSISVPRKLSDSRVCNPVGNKKLAVSCVVSRPVAGAYRQEVSEGRHLSGIPIFPATENTETIWNLIQAVEVYYAIARAAPGPAWFVRKLVWV